MTCGRGIIPTHTGIILQCSGTPGSLPLHTAGAILGTTAAGIGDLTHGIMTLGTTAAGTGILGTTTLGDGDTHPGIGILGTIGDGDTHPGIGTAIMDGTEVIILTTMEVDGLDTGVIGCPDPRQSADVVVTEWVQSPPMSGV